MNKESLFPTLFRSPTLPAISRGSLFPLTEWFNTAFEELFPPAPSIRARVTKEEYLAEMPLGGIEDPQNIEVSVENQMVTVRAAAADGSHRYNYCFRVPKWVKIEELSAHLQENTLSVRAPRPPEARPHYVPVERVTSKKDAVT